MTQLSPGQNVALPPAPGTITLRVQSTAAHVDLIALLLDDDDTADGDNGVVLFSNLSAAGGHVVLDVATDTVTIDAAAMSADIAKILVVAQADGQPTVQGAGIITASVDADGAPAASAQFDAAATPVATLQLAEIYRHGGGWKVRALGDGYAEGLEKLLTVHGVEVDDDEPEAPTQAAPAAPAQAAPAPTPAAPTPAASSAAPTPAATSQPAPAAPTPPISLTKPSLPASGVVSLVKGQGVSLVKESGGALNKVSMGLGWDPAARGKSIDLDASCVLLDAAGKKKDAVWFLRTKAKSGAVQHSGDNLTGAGEGDDETITVDLSKVPADVKYLVFTVNSFSGQKFDQIARAHCRLLDDAGAEVVRYELSQLKATTGLIVCALVRGAAGWEMSALGEGAKGRTYKGMAKEITQAALALG